MHMVAVITKSLRLSEGRAMLPVLNNPGERTDDLRAVVDAMLDISHTGCPHAQSGQLE